MTELSTSIATGVDNLKLFHFYSQIKILWLSLHLQLLQHSFEW